MTESLEGSRIGRVYVASVGYQGPRVPPRHRILVQFGGRQVLGEKMIGQGDVVMVAFGWGGEGW
jgi:hypothetical protein